MQLTTLPSTGLPHQAGVAPTGAAAKLRPANFDATAGAEAPGQFDAPLPKPDPAKKARAVAFDPTAGAEGPEPSHTADTGEMSFWDLVDAVNPLHHLPVVGTIYRQLTGDKIGGAARIMGGALYGGPIGMLAGVAETLFEQSAGGDIETKVAQLITGKTAATGTDMQLALAQNAKSAAVSAAQTGVAGAAAAVGTAGEVAAKAAEGAAKAASNATEAAAEAATKPAGPSALFSSLQKPAKGGAAAQPTGPVIEIRPRDQASTAAARPAAAPAATDGAAAKPGNAAALPPQLVADMMMGALDKYAKMKQGGETAGRTVDKAL